MIPKWPKLASLAQKYVHPSFRSLVHSLLPKNTLLRTYFTSLQLVTGTCGGGRTSPCPSL